MTRLSENSSDFVLKFCKLIIQEHYIYVCSIYIASCTFPTVHPCKMRGNTLGGDHCQSWIMNLEPDYLRKLLVEISRAAIGNDIIMTSESKSEKEGFSSRRGGFICGNWFNESTPFNWFLLTSTTDIISIHWLDGIGLNFPRRCLQRRTFEILGYMRPLDPSACGTRYTWECHDGTWIIFEFSAASKLWSWSSSGRSPPALAGE